MIAVVLSAVVLFGAALAGMVGLATASHRTTDVGYRSYQPATEAPVTGAGSPAATATAGTAPTTNSAPTRSRTSAATPSIREQAGPQPVYDTGNNPLFTGDFGAPAVTCNLPRWRTDPASAQAFFEAALPCLNQAWEPVMRAANLPFQEPELSFPAGRNWHSACGSGTADQWSAFYCSVDNTIYMPFEGLQTSQYGAHPGIYLAVFAHEYGHHVQDMSGVLRAAHEQQYDAGPDTPAGLQISRRIELQADCFGGMFWAAATGRGSVDRNMYDEAMQDQPGRGDDNGVATRSDHGNGSHVQSWTLQGSQKNRTAECNTWKAPDEWVG